MPSRFRGATEEELAIIDYKVKRGLVEFTCLQCGQRVTGDFHKNRNMYMKARTNYRESSRAFCSRTCSSKHSGTLYKPCVVCNSMTKNRYERIVLCSEKCIKAHRNSRANRERESILSDDNRRQKHLKTRREKDKLRWNERGYTVNGKNRFIPVDKTQEILLHKKMKETKSVTFMAVVKYGREVLGLKAKKLTTSKVIRAIDSRLARSGV